MSFFSFSLTFLLFYNGLASLRCGALPGCSRLSSTESFRGASFRLGSFFLSILRRGVRVERMEKTRRDRGDFIDRSQERGFIRLRRFAKTSDFSYELERCRSNFFGSDGRIEVEEGFDIAAHFSATSHRSELQAVPRHFLTGKLPQMDRR